MIIHLKIIHECDLFFNLNAHLSETLSHEAKDICLWKPNMLILSGVYSSERYLSQGLKEMKLKGCKILS